MLRRPLAIDIRKVEKSLLDVQENFDRINEMLEMRREPMRDDIVQNLLSAYEYVNMLLDSDINLLKQKGFHHFLELNHIVLCGTGLDKRKTYIKHIETTTNRFYQQQEFSISHLRKWAEKHQGDSAWKQASGAYILQLSWPQLFAEGNHRTGALLMSTILVRMGKPPFVLSVENAKGYFDPSSLAKSTRKTDTISRLYKLPKIKKNLALFLENNANSNFLVPL